MGAGGGEKRSRDLNLGLWPRAYALQRHLLSPSGRSASCSQDLHTCPSSPLHMGWNGARSWGTLALLSPFKPWAPWGGHWSSLAPANLGAADRMCSARTGSVFSGLALHGGPGECYVSILADNSILGTSG